MMSTLSMLPDLVTWLWTAGALVLVCGAGAGVAALLGRRPEASSDRMSGTRANNTTLGFGRAHLLGVAVLALVLHVPLAAFGHISHLDFALAMGLCAALSLWFVVRHFPPRDWWPAIADGWVNDLPFRVRLIPIAVFFAAFLMSIGTPLTTYDARTAFALKARILYDTGDIRGEDFNDINRVHFNAHYPLLVPLVEAEMFWAQGSYEDHALRLIFLLFVASLASVVASELRRYESGATAAVWTLALLSTPMIIVAWEGGGMSGSADVPLACFITAGVLELAAWLRSRDNRDAVLAALLLGAAMTTKPEGAIWVGMIGAGLLATFVFRRVPKGCQAPYVKVPDSFAPFARTDLKAAALAVACLFVAFGLSVAIRRTITPSPYYRDYAQALRWDWIKQVWHRPLDVIPFAVRNYLTLGFWNLAWPAAALGLCLRRQRGVPADIWFARAAVLILLAAMLGIFVITPYHVQFQLRTAFGRLSLQFLPLAAVLLAENLSASGWVAEVVRHWNAAWAATQAAYAKRLAAERAALHTDAPAEREESEPASLAA